MSREIYHYHDADFTSGVRADVYAATGEAWSEGRPYSSLTRNYTGRVIIQDAVLTQFQFAGQLK